MTEWHPDYFKKLVKEAIREMKQEDELKTVELAWKRQQQDAEFHKQEIQKRKKK
jgi:hypothetical protein